MDLQFDQLALTAEEHVKSLVSLPST
jgi:hypothetical protein